MAQLSEELSFHLNIEARKSAITSDVGAFPSINEDLGMIPEVSQVELSECAHAVDEILLKEHFDEVQYHPLFIKRVSQKSGISEAELIESNFAVLEDDKDMQMQITAELSSVIQESELRAYFVQINPQVACRYIDQEFNLLLSEGDPSTFDIQLDKLVRIASAINIGETVEIVEHIPSTVLLNDQTYFLRDLQFYRKYPNVFNFTQNIQEETLPVERESRYSSVAIFDTFVESLSSLGVKDIEKYNFLYLQPSIKPVSSKFMSFLMYPKFRESIRVLSDKESKVDWNGYMEDMEMLLEDLSPDRLEGLRALAREDTQITQDDFRCRLYMDTAQQLDEVLNLMHDAGSSIALKISAHRPGAGMLVRHSGVEFDMASPSSALLEAIEKGYGMDGYVFPYVGFYAAYHLYANTPQGKLEISAGPPTRSMNQLTHWGLTKISETGNFAKVLPGFTENEEPVFSTSLDSDTYTDHGLKFIFLQRASLQKLIYAKFFGKDPTVWKKV